MTKQPNPMDNYYLQQGKMLSCRLPNEMYVASAQEDYMYVAPGQYDVTFTPELREILETNNDTRGTTRVNDSTTNPGISGPI